MTLVNLTPHALTLVAPDGSSTILPPSGTVARVSTTPGTVGDIGLPCLVAEPTAFGAVVGLPDPVPGTFLIVSGLVGSALVGKGRTDVLTPGTGPNDNAVRNESGHVVGVTRLVRVAP